MKHLKIKKIFPVLLSTTLTMGVVSEGIGILSKVSAGTSEIAVYEQPNEDATLVEYITTDTVAKIIGEAEDKNGEYWYKIIWGHDDIGFEGYITEENASYLFNDNSMMMLLADDDTVTVGVEAFPKDYQALLTSLQAAHPNWTFVPYYVQPTWDTVVTAEMNQKSNFVYTTEVFSMKNLSAYNWATDTFTGGSGPNWILASQSALEYYLEPRNFITEENIFLFESMRYNEALHTEELVEAVLAGTFMANAYVDGSEEIAAQLKAEQDAENESEASGGDVDTDEENSTTESTDSVEIVENSGAIASEEEGSVGTSSDSATESATVSTEQEEVLKLTYAEAFVQIGKEYDVSPVMLASRCRQEQGANGTSALISGTVSGYEGYYNYFNIQASGVTQNDIITNGLNWAIQQGWDSPYKALKGGSLAIATNYVMKNQDTLYMQKFDVDPEYQNMYWHQYMGALASPSAEGRTAKHSYTDLGVLDSYFVFKIPVYTNRPDTLPTKPTDDTNPNNYLSAITLNNGEYTLNFVYSTQSYTLEVPYECEKMNVVATPVSSKASVQGNGTHLLDVGTNEITLKVTAQSGEVRNYIVTIVRSNPVTQNVTVNGVVTSWDNLNNEMIKLYNSNLTDEAIRSDMATGNPTLALEYGVTVENATSSEQQYSASFAIKDVENGTYKIAIYKPGRYVVAVEEITVENEDVTIEDIDMWLYGDVNYDGRVDVLDITQVTRYINLKTSVFDTGDDQTKQNRFIAADVVGDDGAVDVQDITQYTRYINLKTSIFDTMN